MEYCKFTLCLSLFLAATFLLPEKALSVSLDKLPLEEAAYFSAANGDHAGGRNWKAEYIKKLSPGGKVYFLANRRDYKEALQALEKLLTRNTGSGLYVKAFCLEGLGQHAEAVKYFEASKAKIGGNFSPGFRFYLRSATAHMRVGNEKNSLADLETAGPESEEYGKFNAYPRYVRAEIDKRKVAVVEYKGRYKEACEKYLAMFNKVNDQFRLNESLTGDAQSKTRAASWLAEHKAPLPSKSETEQAIYFLTKGRAEMVLGSIAEAKTSLTRAAWLPPGIGYAKNAERFKFEDFSVFMRIKDQAKSLLVKIFYKEKDYRKCCEIMRTLFNEEVMLSLDTMYNVIAMHDIQELMTQRDEELHDVYVEFKLDKNDVVVIDPKKAKSY